MRGCRGVRGPDVCQGAVHVHVLYRCLQGLGEGLTADVLFYEGIVLPAGQGLCLDLQSLDCVQHSVKYASPLSVDLETCTYIFPTDQHHAARLLNDTPPAQLTV